ncbi:hypothetical protein CAEBREN_22607 [Caenorhabditis brenneri]|uniref:CX domain-containing protein n=1 Tax=Caenorhabditis brenneri TaxID=135651 RepID=G0NTZ6_CAEBE|nr:hypothetical protein CAEBREN_22607 [Caenorhabditis brenneri]
MKSATIFLVLIISVSAIFGNIPSRKKHHPPIETYPIAIPQSLERLRSTSSNTQPDIRSSLPIRYHCNLNYSTGNLLNRFNDNNYYWYGNYVPDRRQPMKCEYHFDQYDYEFQNITFPDGSKPKSLQFGCLSYQNCCGLECCGDTRSSSLLLWFILMVIVTVTIGFRKYTARMRLQRGSTSSSVISIHNPNNDPSIELHEV